MSPPLHTSLTSLTYPHSNSLPVYFFFMVLEFQFVCGGRFEFQFFCGGGFGISFFLEGEGGGHKPPKCCIFFISFGGMALLIFLVWTFLNFSLWF